jgi:hypothetical protein
MATTTENDPYGILSADKEITPEMLKEVEARPIGTTSLLTAEQFALRVRIGKMLTRNMYTDALEHAAPLAPCYLQFPPYLFYCLKDSPGMIMRVFGWRGLTMDGPFYAKTLTSHPDIKFSAFVDGHGYARSELQAMERWPVVSEARLRANAYPDSGVFLDPLGFMDLVQVRK